MLGGLFSRWVDSAHHSWENDRSLMLISNQNNCKQNSPRIVVSWRQLLFLASHGLMIVGGGGVKTLPFCLGTAYNVSSMEDSEKSWLLCWQRKHTYKNYFHLYFKIKLSHLYKSLLPSAKGLSFTFMQESVVFLLIPTYSLVGKHHVMETSRHIRPFKYIWAWIITVDITLEVKGREAKH